MIEFIILGYLAIVNLAALAMYGIDKQNAIADKRRIPEKTLLLAALIGGSVGAFAGMRVFRHKTKHWQFMLGVPACIFLHIGLGLAYLWFFVM